MELNFRAGFAAANQPAPRSDGKRYRAADGAAAFNLNLGKAADILKAKPEGLTGSYLAFLPLPAFLPPPPPLVAR